MNEIFSRVSIRKYEDRPVEEEKIERLLRAAMAAPSTANQQPWEFYVVTDRAKIEELSKVTPFTGAAAGAPVVFVPCYRTTRQGRRVGPAGSVRRDREPSAGSGRAGAGRVLDGHCPE